MSNSIVKKNIVHVLLVSSQTMQEYYSPTVHHPPVGDLGIRSLAAWLNSFDIGTDIIPAHAQSESETLQRIANNPDLKILGISLNITGLLFARKITRLAKINRPNLIIILGGYLPTFGSQEILNEWSEVDYIVRGEGESPLLALCRNILGLHGYDLAQIHGISFRQDGKIINNEIGMPIVDLGNLPPPLRNVANMPDICTDVMVSASRGCYGKCNFCSIASFNGGYGKNPWRGRNTELIAEEIAELRSRFKAEFIHFVDDSFLGPQGRLERCIELKDAFERRKLEIPFLISMRANDVDKECIKILKECGLAAVHLGIESFSSRQLRDVYNKGIAPETNLQAINILAEERIHTQLGIILFEPTVSLDDIETNCKHILKTGSAVVKGNDCMLFCADGTVLADRLIQSGQSLGKEDYINNIWAFEDTKSERIYKLLRDFNVNYPELPSNLINLISPPYYLSATSTELLKKLYLKYKELSYGVLMEILSMVRDGLKNNEIAANIFNKYNSEYSDVVANLNAIFLQEKGSKLM